MGWGRKACGEVRLIYGQGLNKRGYIRVGQKDTGQDTPVGHGWTRAVYMYYQLMKHFTAVLILYPQTLPPNGEGLVNFSFKT